MDGRDCRCRDPLLFVGLRGAELKRTTGMPGTSENGVPLGKAAVFRSTNQPGV
jgi:hypothetical protein